MSEVDLRQAPVGGEALAEERGEWARRRELWDRIRAHERQRRVHARLSEEHDAAASQLLKEVDSA